MAANLGPNYAPFLLTHLKKVIGDNAPETKITPTGFLKMAIENTPSLKMPEYEKLRISNSEGHVKQIRLSYLKRIIPGSTSTTDDCSNDLIPVYSDMVLDAPHFRKFSLFISDYDIAKYMEDASATVAVGQPATQFMQEHLTTLQTVVNTLLADINTDLLGDITWGKNASNGSYAKTININQDATINDLSSGFSELLNDVDENEITGDLLMTGSGLFNKFMRQRPFLGTNQSGVNNAAAEGFKWYLDLYSRNNTAKWGTDVVGAFAPGSIGFIDLQKFIAFRSGYKGSSYFFQIMLPVQNAQSDGTADIMTFDAQMRYLDCPTEIYNGYETVTVNRGWQLIISKNFGLFQQPIDAYNTGDRLAGTNGALKYTFTNS